MDDRRDADHGLDRDQVVEGGGEAGTGRTEDANAPTVVFGGDDLLDRDATDAWRRAQDSQDRIREDVLGGIGGGGCEEVSPPELVVGHVGVERRDNSLVGPGLPGGLFDIAPILPVLR